MNPVMVSAATGVLNPVLGKLTTLLSDEFNLVSGVKRGIQFLSDELSSMKVALEMLADMDDDKIDPQTKEWRSKVRELSYDIEDCIDRFMLCHGPHGGDAAKDNFLRKFKRKLTKLWGDHKIGKEIKELKARVVEEKERRDRYRVDERLRVPQPGVPLDPRAPAFYEEARDLVGIDGPRDEIIGWIKGEERQLKVVSIYGIGGQGKTTLAMEVYRKIEDPFDCRASVTVSRTLDIKKILRDLLFQINKSEYERLERGEVDQLIRTLRQQLMDKRYLIVIDDIWTTLAWEHVKSALSDNDNRSRIIMTTRIRDVAESCCTSIGGHMYEAKPLSEDDSRTLFFRRTFGSSENCPQELERVANGILKKCDGLALAIISIASLLANKSRTVEVWDKTLNSISCAVEKGSPIERMRSIWFLSYFDLPHHLKSCLLYLSVFPEDYSINCRQLIWAWVAEGLIPGQNRESMEQQGESYLIELINRSMIQPTKISFDGKTVKFCRVHDVVLDFVIYQAVADNFVAICTSGKGFVWNHSYKTRRLSIQMDNFGAEEMAKAMNGVSHLRSVNIFGSHLGKNVPEFLNSQVLRVLNVQGCPAFQGYHVGHITSCAQLKYLRITKNTGVDYLPEEIGKLQHLETLDVTGLDINFLPASIVQLQKLVRLFVPESVHMPDGIGNLKALEELFSITLYQASAKCIQGLCELTKLRELGIVCRDTEGHKKACILSLSKLMVNLRTLHVLEDCVYSDFTLALMAPDSDFMQAFVASSGWTPPLEILVLNHASKLPAVPSGISSLVNLTRLKFTVCGEVSKEGLNILASLPMLLSLTVNLPYNIDGPDDICPRHVIGRQGFRRLVKFNFANWHDNALEFEPGALPKLQRLKLTVTPRRQFKYGEGGQVIGLQNLSSLKHITLRISSHFRHFRPDWKEAALENDIRGAAGAHPNRPVLEVTIAYMF